MIPARLEKKRRVRHPLLLVSNIVHDDFRFNSLKSNRMKERSAVKRAQARVPALLEGSAHGVSGFEGEPALYSERLGFEERRAGAMVAFTRGYNDETGCVCAISAKRQKALASCIWRGLRHSGSNRRGLPTTMTLDMAREVATLKRLRL